MFRWHMNHDVALVQEVLAIRPVNPADWNVIDENLPIAWGIETPLKSRSCKEHLDLLLRHHKDGNTAALKK